MEFILKVENLTKDYNGFLAIENISFATRPGEIFGLLGPNGAGKTTTIRTIATILSPTSGNAFLNGANIRENPQEIRKHIGVLTTDVGAYDRFTGRENLRYFGELYNLDKDRLENRINELSNLLQMQEFLDKLASKYSTGMKQKLALARSIIHDPELIIFDEPTSGLDVLASQTVLKFMRHAKDQGKCIIFSTHHLYEAEKLCERVAIIHHGKLIACDSVLNLKTKTNTGDLEDAFLALVNESKVTERHRIKRESPKIQKIKEMTRIISVLLVIIGVGLIFAPGLQKIQPVAYILIILGALVALLTPILTKGKVS